MVEQIERSRNWLAQAAVLTMALAGVLHLFVVREHWAHAPAHGLFFLIAGVIEIGWSITFIRTGSEALRRLGFLGSVVLVLLWGLTRFVPAPFGHGPEAVDVAGVATKACEIACAAALGLLIAAGAASAASQPRRIAWRPVFGLVLAAFLLTALTYGAARAAEPVLPGLSAEAVEQHEHDEPATVDHDHVDPTGETHEH
jgi:hypothetical protein